MKHILISGGSGLIGKKITQILEKKGFEVAWLSRSPDEYSQKSFAWDIDKQEIDSEAVNWADAIIHLAGAGVADKRWTAERKQEILHSRTQSTKLLYSEIEKTTNKPKVFVSASAIGYYGFDTGDTLLDENSPQGSDFLAEVVGAWENEVFQIKNLGVRTVAIRVGIVLDKDGGALKEMMKPPVTAPLGSGKQAMSWIQLDDLARIFTYALENDSVEGVYNGVGPKPATNTRVTELAAKKVMKPFVNIGVPGFGLKLILGEMADMVLGGNKVSNQKLVDAGFTYRYPTLEEAMEKTFNG